MNPSYSRRLDTSEWNAWHGRCLWRYASSCNVVSLPTLGRDSCFEAYCRPQIRTVLIVGSSPADHDGRRPFLLPSANAWRRNALDFVSETGDLGLSLPDWLLDESDDDDWDADRSRPSRRMSSRDTLRSGRVYVGASAGSRISWNFEGMVASVEEVAVQRVWGPGWIPAIEGTARYVCFPQWELTIQYRRGIEILLR
jgi:hypothetical protein